MMYFLFLTFLILVESANIWGAMSPNNRDTNEATSSRIANAAVLQFNEPSAINQLSNPSCATLTRPGAYNISGVTNNNRPPPARTVATLITANIVPQTIAVPIANDRNQPASYDTSVNYDQEFIVDSLDQLVGSQKK